MASSLPLKNLLGIGNKNALPATAAINHFRQRVYSASTSLRTGQDLKHNLLIMKQHIVNLRVLQSLIVLITTVVNIDAQFFATKAQLYADERMIRMSYGSVDFLKSQNILKLDFDYSDMTVGNEFEKEKDFVTDKVNRLNQRNPGKGDNWAKQWFGKRMKNYEPSFELAFNNSAKSMKLSCGKDYEANYTMVVHTTHTNIITPVNTLEYTPSYIDAVITFTEVSTGKKEAVFILEHFGADDIVAAYTSLGKYFAKYLKEKLKSD